MALKMSGSAAFGCNIALGARDPPSVTDITFGAFAKETRDAPYSPINSRTYFTGGLP